MAAPLKQKHEFVAHGIAGGLTPEESYAKVYGETKGGKASAHRLLRNEAFRSRVEQLRKQVEQNIPLLAPREIALTQIEVAIAEKHQQVRVYWKDFLATEQIIEERRRFFLDPDNQIVKSVGGLKNLPGASTGYVFIKYKGSGSKFLPELHIDTALMAERRAIMQHVGRLIGFVDAPNINLVANQTNNNSVSVQQNNVTIQPKDSPPPLANCTPEQLQSLLDLAAACKAAGVPVEIPESVMPAPIQVNAPLPG